MNPRLAMIAGATLCLGAGVAMARGQAVGDLSNVRIGYRPPVRVPANRGSTITRERPALSKLESLKRPKVRLR